MKDYQFSEFIRILSDEQKSQLVQLLSDDQKLTLSSIIKQNKHSESIEEKIKLLSILDENNIFDIKETRFSGGLFCPKC